MAPSENPAPASTGYGASKIINAGELDGSKFTTPLNYKQDYGRIGQAVSLHFACARVIENLARQYAISASHAATVADLSGIGGRRI